jgi:hypothetical protein
MDIVDVLVHKIPPSVLEFDIAKFPDTDLKFTRLPFTTAPSLKLIALSFIFKPLPVLKVANDKRLNSKLDPASNVNLLSSGNVA